jgi:hypothetical protein
VTCLCSHDTQIVLDILDNYRDVLTLYCKPGAEMQVKREKMLR